MSDSGHSHRSRRWPERRSCEAPTTRLAAARTAPTREQRHAEHAAGRRVEQAVEPAEHAEQPDEREPGGEAPVARAAAHGTPVAPRLHRGGEAEGALERRLEHGHREPGGLAEPGALVPAQGARRSHRAGVCQQLRGKGEADHDGGADVVERGRQVTQQPPGAGEGVGGTEAREDRGQSQAVVDGIQQRLERDRAA